MICDDDARRPAPTRRGAWLPLVLTLASLALLLTVSVPAAAAQTLAVTIAWDPSPDADVAGYVVYVGAESGKYAQQYDVGAATIFDFSTEGAARTYFFAVRAYNTSAVLSELSNEVSTTLGATGINTGTSQDAQPPKRQRWPDVGTDRSTISQNGDSTSVRPRDVRALAAAAGEGVLFVEDRRLVRLLTRDNELPDEPLLAAAAAVELTGLATDPFFARTGLVFVGEVETLTDGARELTIARYRLAGHTLGERAVIVDGIDLPAEGDAPFDIDPAGHLYVAVPRAGADQGRAGAPYSGMILRFNVDGTVPRDNQYASPVLAYGYGQPTALKFDESGRLWLAGAGGPWPQPIAMLNLNTESVPWPATPRGIPLTLAPDATGVSALEVVRNQRPADSSKLLLLSGERLALIEFSSDRVIAPVSWSLTGHGTPTGLLLNGSQALFVAFTSARGGVRISESTAIEQFQFPSQ